MGPLQHEHDRILSAINGTYTILQKKSHETVIVG